MSISLPSYLDLSQALRRPSHNRTELALYQDRVGDGAIPLPTWAGSQMPGALEWR